MVAPPAKRARRNERTSGTGTSTHTCTETDAADDSASSPPSHEEAHLSPDLWARVMVYLPYADILNCTLVNRTILQEAAPKVTDVRISTARQMRAVPARRFSGVRRIKIDCLFQDNYDRMQFSREAVGMVVPFLGCFPSLREASMGGTIAHAGRAVYLEYGDRVGGQPLLENERLMRSMLLGLAGAYRTGTIRSNVRISGVLLGTGCNNTNRYDGRPDASWAECAQCLDICNSFPLEEVAAFETNKVRKRRAVRDRYQCQVCLPMVRILKIVMSRTGGKQLLLDPAFFLEQVVFYRRKCYFAALKLLNLLPLIDIDRGDIKLHMAGEHYKMAPRCIEGYLFDELVAAGIPLNKEDFDIIEKPPFRIEESLFNEMVALGIQLKREDFDMLE